MSQQEEDHLKAETAQLQNELRELQLLNENAVEHRAALENQLVEQHSKLDALQTKMKKYLAPNLYQSLVGGTSAAPPRHIRKKLTVFFSDIVGFSEITDSIETELLSDVLSQYLNQMADIATRWGGTIDKFIGDAVMVFFGDPEFIDDATHARNCVKMAMEMRRQLSQLRVKWREKGLFQDLRVRMGINTGFCTVGDFGSRNRMDYTIIGSQVNIAARLESIAEPDTIYISHATASLVEDTADCEYVDSIMVKGVPYPIDVCKVHGDLGVANVSSASLCQKTKSGFKQAEIEYDAITVSPQERRAIRDALHAAIRLVSCKIHIAQVWRV